MDVAAEMYAQRMSPRKLFKANCYFSDTFVYDQTFQQIHIQIILSQTLCSMLISKCSHANMVNYNGEGGKTR